MNVLLLNGSPSANGCTYTALWEVAGALEREGIQTEIFHAGKGPVAGCTGCGACKETGRCMIDDGVNRAIEKAKEADGLILGAPVHYGGAAGVMTTFLDRLFYAAGGFFAYKPGGALVSCRRGGATAALDRLNKYFTISCMPVVSSQYWNMVHGNTPEEVRQDLEGMQTLRLLGQNMAWLLKSIQAGRQAGLPIPQAEPRIRTNFIR
ncbi:MAG: flavodoxin family protein [Oscillospiraceae bacterium]|nr:flavodoxin family protein [Oscillospiraceae bacterium]